MIRRASFLDVEDIYHIEKQLFDESLGLEFIANDIVQNDMAYYFVYEYEDKIVGFISSWISDNTTILNFGVLPQYREHGFGSELLDEVIKIAKGDITLEVRPSNKRALAFYQHRGFKEISLRKNYYSNGEDAILMMRC